MHRIPGNHDAEARGCQNPHVFGNSDFHRGPECELPHLCISLIELEEGRKFRLMLYTSPDLCLPYSPLMQFSKALSIESSESRRLSWLQDSTMVDKQRGPLAPPPPGTYADLRGRSLLGSAVNRLGFFYRQGVSSVLFR